MVCYAIGKVRIFALGIGRLTLADAPEDLGRVRNEVVEDVRATEAAALRAAAGLDMLLGHLDEGWIIAEIDVDLGVRIRGILSIFFQQSDLFLDELRFVNAFGQTSDGI